MFSMILNLQTLFHIYRFCYLNIMSQIKLVMKCSTVCIHIFVLLLSLIYFTFH